MHCATSLSTRLACVASVLPLPAAEEEVEKVEEEAEAAGVGKFPAPELLGRALLVATPRPPRGPPTFANGFLGAEEKEEEEEEEEGSRESVNGLAAPAAVAPPPPSKGPLPFRCC